MSPTTITTTAVSPTSAGGMLAWGWKPCPKHDDGLRRHLLAKGYELARTSKSLDWYRPPAEQHGGGQAR